MSQRGLDVQVIESVTPGSNEETMNWHRIAQGFVPVKKKGSFPLSPYCLLIGVYCLGYVKRLETIWIITDTILIKC